MKLGMYAAKNGLTLKEAIEVIINESYSRNTKETKKC